MDSMMMIAALVVLAAGFVVYPRLMISLVGSLLRGLFGIIADGVALLIAWI